MIQVLFVCLGNICRSPTAEAVFRHQVEQADLSAHITVDSAGTGDWHLGHPPDQRAQQAASKRGYDLSALRARQVDPEDFARFDYVLAMDSTNLHDLNTLSACSSFPQRCIIKRFLQYAPNSRLMDVPDPYYGDKDGFDHVLDLIEDASEGLLHEIRQGLSRGQ